MFEQILKYYFPNKQILIVCHIREPTHFNIIQDWHSFLEPGLGHFSVQYGKISISWQHRTKQMKNMILLKGDNNKPPTAKEFSFTEQEIIMHCALDVYVHKQ